eukprot:TRINITY_DN4804_c0_g1_i2.p1 TRINITY_DN4804_c0_g1~~TRINITY_DN4804_c0_g1_i2.p1  ORF type:complete len:251 (+),score=73.96 TRINITY_DN4804_c0_g1_i2:41-754(+)
MGGGRDIDTVLVQHFAKEFLSKYNLDVMAKAKAVLRLVKDVCQLKTVLSANKEGVLNIESIMDDKDVSSRLNRDELEEMIKPLLDRVLKPCEQVLASSNTKIEEIHSIEIVGGGSRVPAIRKRLEEFFKKPVSQTLNGDETVARGCALQCAMISPAFKVRNFDVVDVAPYPVEMCWGPVNDNFVGDDTEFKDALQVFHRLNKMPSIKTISFSDREPFQVILRYQDASSLPAGTSRFI